MNYSARNFGVKRHTPVHEAIALCPQLRLVHVPTYNLNSISTSSNDLEELIAIPQYNDQIPSFKSDGTRILQPPPDPGSNKACLEPYRQASILIFRILRDWCSTLAPGTLLEKGGLDEAFLDITDEVEEQLIDEFASKYTMIRDELNDIENEELEVEALTNLALYNTEWIDNLDYTALGERVDVEFNVTEDQNREIDLVDKMRKSLGKLRIWKGCQLARTLRSRLHMEINYIASIGIASNKMLSKLVSAIFKPDKQTRIEPDQISEFMKQVPFEKIRMMGGKVGQRVLKARGSGGNDDEDNEEEEDDMDEGGYDDTNNNISILDESSTRTSAQNNVNVANSAADLWPLSVTDLTNRLGDRVTAQWIYNLIRGVDPSPVTPRSQIKSFMSAKAFRPAVKDWSGLHDWCIVLVGELWSRMQEEKEQTSRWPATMTVYWRAYIPGTTRMRWSNVGAISKSCEFPFASSMPLQATPKSFLEVIFKIFKGEKDPSRSRTATINTTNVTSMSRHSTSDPISLFPMSYLAVSVSNFKSLESDGKARPTRVDQFFIKSTEIKELPPSMEHLFKKTEPANALIAKTADVQQNAPIKRNKNVLEMLQQRQAKTSEGEDASLVGNGEILKQVPKPKRPKSGGILDFFPKQTQTTIVPQIESVFHCKKCSFSCNLDEYRSIQEHDDYHMAVELSKQL